MLSLLCALRQFSLVCGCAQSSVVSQLAIDLGAAAAWHAPTAPSEPATVHVLVPDDTVVDSFCEAISNGAGNSLISHSDAEELYEPYDWEIEDDDPLAFRPQLINRRLWVAPMLCNEEAVPAPPSHASLRLRLLDSRDGNVFLATRDNTLHASTLMLLYLLCEHRDELTGRVLDFGCGSGILAIAALLLGRGPNLKAQATDVVQEALFCARRNAQLNDIDEDRLSLYLPWEMPSLRATDGRALNDVAVANMLPGPLLSVALELAGRVRTGGLLCLTGFRECDRLTVTAGFEEYFTMPAEASIRRDGYIALACRRNDVPLRIDDMSASAVE